MKVEVLYGKRELLHCYCSDLAKNNSKALVFVNAPRSTSCGWGAVRRLLDQIRLKLGGESINTAIERHAPAAALVFPDLRCGLSREQSLQAEKLSANPVSHMTHNWVLQYPLFQEWATILMELILGRGFTLIVPDVGLLCSEDAAVLKFIYRLCPDKAPDLVLGFDPHMEPQVDKDGISWNLEYMRQRRFVMDFRAISKGEARSIPEADAKHYDDICELLPPVQGGARSIEEVRGSFKNFSFTAALALGLDLLESGTVLDPAVEAEAHAIVAVSAHNRQFKSRGNTDLALFLERHLRAVLSADLKPVERCALLYRLSVILGRRQGRFSDALECAEEALAIVREAPVLSIPESYQKAWAHNIKSFLLMRLGQFEESRLEVEMGFLSIASVLGAIDDTAWERDVKSSGSILAHNCVGLVNFWGRHTEDVEIWLHKATQLMAGIEGSERFEYFSWVDLCRRKFALHDALVAALRGLESARAELDSESSYYYEVSAADLLYRLGDFENARRHFEAARETRRRCGRPLIVAIDVLIALSFMDSGYLDEALQALEGILANGAVESVAIRAQVWAWIAVVTAKMGERQKSIGSANQALALSRENGKRETLIKVGWITGYSFQLLGEYGQSRKVYGESFRYSEANGAEPVPASDRLCILLGLLECGDHRFDIVCDLLNLIPSALGESTTWWAMGRLLRVLNSKIVKFSDSWGSADLADPLEKLLSAARQQRNCDEPLRTLLNNLDAAKLSFTPSTSS